MGKNLLNIPAENVETIIINCGALLLLAGILVNTSVYRKRGRLSDRIFFAVIITDIILAVADVVRYAADDKPTFFWLMVLQSANILYLLCFEIWGLLFLMFILCITNMEETVRKRWRLFLIPAVLSFVLVAVELVIHFNRLTGPVSRTFPYQKPYLLLLIIPIICAVVILTRMIAVHRELVLFFVFMVAVRIALFVFMSSVSSTPFLFAVGLSYAHICVMNHAFFGKEVSGQ